MCPEVKSDAILDTDGAFQYSVGAAAVIIRKEGGKLW
jgi:hypothetical protein